MPFTPRQHAQHLRRMEGELRFALEREVRLGMEAGAKLAESFIGEPQPGWDGLKPSTLAEKERKGYDVPAPLKRTGDLKGSFVGEAEEVGGGVHGAIGSTSEHAVYSEIGTSRESPRPALVPAMMLIRLPMEKALQETGRRALTPGQKL